MVSDMTRSASGVRGDGKRIRYGPEGDNSRAVSSRSVLESLTRVTFDEFARAVWDTRLSTADERIRALQEEWTKIKTANATDLPDELRAARGRADLAQVIARLGQWNHVADAESVETTWLVLANERRGLAVRRQDTRPYPMLRALVETMELLQRRWGRIDVPWGSINRLQRPLPGAAVTLDTTRQSLPVDGVGGLGSVFTFYSEPFGEAGPRIGVAGNSFVKVVEFGPTIRARSVLNFGQSGDPASPHFFDQAALYSRPAFKEAWFAEADVKRNAKRSYVVSGGAK